MAIADRLDPPARSAPVPVNDRLAPVRVWLWSIAALVFLMVVVGGATRLTESGLSITEWKLVSGIAPPLSDAQWQAEFTKYKEIPQYSQLFPTMSLADFKFIYFFEWAHRLLGRLIGAAFALPLIWFWLTRSLPERLKLKLVAVFALGGLQGVVGWWMVKSGLSERVEVSQYRLAVHLLLASLTGAALLWLAAGLRARNQSRGDGPVGGRTAGAIAARVRLRFGAGLVLASVFVQIGLGALVAGLRAGLAYNTWPLMDGRLVPAFADLFRQTPWWTNFFENTTLVQFQHRLGAYLVLAVALAHAIDAARNAARPTAARAAALAAVIAIQASVGIATLLLVVPLWAGLLHQACAMLVLAGAVVHCRLSERDLTPRAGHATPFIAARAPASWR